MVIGDASYTNFGDGWLGPAETDIRAMTAYFRNAGIAFINTGGVVMIEGATLSDVRSLAEESLDSKACVVYSYTSATQALTTQNKLWVEKSTGLPLKLSYEVTRGDGVPEGTIFTNVYEYDADFEIPPC